jgi:prolyl-tRNA synthetase
MRNTRSQNYTQWYQDVIEAADLAENSLVRGCMVIKPWGNGIWERIKFLLNRMIEETGHENCYFPLFVPLSLFEKEAAHIDGFAKEMALVTHTRLRQVEGKLKLEGELEEPLVVRPTSETLIAESFSRWIQSYRDLPVLINQWANVVRWEMRPRLFLRTTEFLWQEGHTAHETEAEAMEETKKMLGVYRELAENFLAIPVFTGEKTDSERFPGAKITMCIEAMMQDGKALQAGTSHYLGTSFSKAANIQFQNRAGELEYAHTVSWGVSTRLVGGVIMTHGDDDGLRLPPAIAPAQVILLPLIRQEEEKKSVLGACEKLAKKLRGQIALGEAVRVKIDTRDRKNQDKRWDWIKKGAPLICEIGPRDLASDSVMFSRRDAFKTKQSLSTVEFIEKCPLLLEELQKLMFEQALKYRDNSVRTDIKTWQEFKTYYASKSGFLGDETPGFVRAPWCQDPASEEVLKELGVTIRCIPFEQPSQIGTCVLTGKPGIKEVIFGRSY